MEAPSLGLLWLAESLADDNSIFACGETPEHARFAALGTFTVARQWFGENGLCINENKTHEMIYMQP